MIRQKPVAFARRLQFRGTARFRRRSMATENVGANSSSWARKWGFFGIGTAAGATILYSFYQYYRAKGVYLSEELRLIRATFRLDSPIRREMEPRKNSPKSKHVNPYQACDR